LIVLGLLVFWLPIPLGVPLILLGLTLIIKFSPEFKRVFFQVVTKRVPKLLGVLERIGLKPDS
jgi:hypothetical protein